MHINGIEETHLEIRKKTCEYIKNKEKDFENFMEYTNIDEYLMRMPTARVWADHVAIYGSSRAYGFTLNVFDKTGLYQEINPNQQNIYNIFWKNQNHFDSIIDLQTCIKDDLIQFQCEIQKNKFLNL